jgi:hypothetical protein
MSDIWTRCEGDKQLQSFDSLAYRIVESQEKVATMSLVDTSAEQLLLESLLEYSKPASATSDKLHYLLSTPFRYPPLAHGSRFGVKSQGGLFYASLSTTTTLAECAYYRFVFWYGMEIPPPAQRIMSDYTSFAVSVATHQAILLHQEPFLSYREQISHPANYQHSQQLGESMREADVEACSYFSARDQHNGINIGLFSPKALKSREPQSKKLWSCVVTENQVSFIQLHATAEAYNFPLSDFLYNDSLPMPAC